MPFWLICSNNRMSLKFITQVCLNILDDDIAKRQQQGFGAMLSFEVDFDIEQLKAIFEWFAAVLSGRVIGWSGKSGGAPSEHDACGDGSGRAVAGISDQLLRFSIGIEHITDLLADLDRAFACVASK